MHVYKPDPKATIFISLDGINPSPKWLDRRLASNEYVMKQHAADLFFESLGVKKQKFRQRQLRVDDARTPDIIDQILDLCARREFAIAAAWVEEPRPTDKKPGHEVWYKLKTGPTDYKRVAKIPNVCHFEYFEYGEIASDEFVRFVRESGLKGLATLPLVESRDDDPRVWREVYAEKAIGRGIDHPAIDPDKLEKEQLRNRGWTPACRKGEACAWQALFWDDLSIDEPIVAKLAAIRPPHFRLVEPKRFCLERLPSTDFAYIDWGFKADTGSGARARWGRSICCNARARKVLIDAGLMKPSRFEPIQIVPAADAQSAILDDVIPYPLPLPVYTPEEAEVERRRREQLRAAAPCPKPGLTFDSVPAAIQFLEKRAASPKRAWAPAHEHPDFAKIAKSKLFKKTPTAWQLLAPWLPFEAVLEEGDEQFWFTLSKPEWNTWLIADEGDPDDIPSKHDVVIGTTPFGDWFSFRKSDPLLPGDARIREWDHETSTPRDDWASALGFAAHLVEIADRAAKIGYKPSI